MPLKMMMILPSRPVPSEMEMMYSNPIQQQVELHQDSMNYQIEDPIVPLLVMLLLPPTVLFLQMLLEILLELLIQGPIQAKVHPTPYL